MAFALEFMVIVQLAWLPVHDPDQPVKALPFAGSAVIVTIVPVA